ncbi:hypothetical protein WT61_27760 [Burkholderia stagnalis]|nr:hypothetical protein WT61_27760 [Burkholderia stagnalis]KWH46020.1 hypothetical protein WT62_15475 [Burkholderia stagnalis]
MADEGRALFGELAKQGLLLGDQRIDLRGFEIEEASDGLLLLQWRFHSWNSNQVAGVDSRVAYAYGVRNHLTNKSVGLEKIACKS